MVSTSAGRAGAGSACAGNNLHWPWRQQWYQCAKRKFKAPSQGQPNRGSDVPGNRPDRSRIPELHSVDGSLPWSPVDLVRTAEWYSGCCGLARIGEVFCNLPSAAIHRCRGRFLWGISARLSVDRHCGSAWHSLAREEQVAADPAFRAAITAPGGRRARPYQLVEFSSFGSWLVCVSLNVWQTRPWSQMAGASLTRRGADGPPSASYWHHVRPVRREFAGMVPGRAKSWSHRVQEDKEKIR